MTCPETVFGKLALLMSVTTEDFNFVRLNKLRRLLTRAGLGRDILATLATVSTRCDFHFQNSIVCIVRYPILFGAFICMTVLFEHLLLSFLLFVVFDYIFLGIVYLMDRVNKVMSV